MSPMTKEGFIVVVVLSYAEAGFVESVSVGMMIYVVVSSFYIHISSSVLHDG
jgi:hypothetical protein